MSRCYPYPPPGYEKKAPVELAISPKKEKHKHKDKEKKKKRRKDSEANGDSSHRDKDKRSKKAQQTGVNAVGISLTNGRLPEAKGTPSGTAHEGTSIQRTTDICRDNEVSHKLPMIDREPDNKVGSQLQLVSVRTSDNGIIKTSTDVAPIGTASHVENDLKTEKQAHVVPVEMVWSAIDDQEWLWLCNPSGQKRTVEQSEMAQVWAETMYLPSVGIHALPYVVPD